MEREWHSWMLRSLSAQEERGKALNKSSLFQKLLAFKKKKNRQPESLGLHFTFKCNSFTLQFISADTLESTQIKKCHTSCVVCVKHVLALEEVWQEAALVCK